MHCFRWDQRLKQQWIEELCLGDSSCEITVWYLVFSASGQSSTEASRTYLGAFSKHRLFFSLHDSDITGQMRSFGCCHHHTPVHWRFMIKSLPLKKHGWEKKSMGCEGRVGIWLRSTNWSLLWNLECLLHQSKIILLRKMQWCHWWTGVAQGGQWAPVAPCSKKGSKNAPLNAPMVNKNIMKCPPGCPSR